MFSSVIGSWSFGMCRICMNSILGRIECIIGRVSFDSSWFQTERAMFIDGLALMNKFFVSRLLLAHK